MTPAEMEEPEIVAALVARGVPRDRAVRTARDLVRRRAGAPLNPPAKESPNVQ